MKKQSDTFFLFRERHLMLILAILCLPLIILLMPLILFIRLRKSKNGARIALIVSDKWPDYLQYARFPYDLALFRAGAGIVTISPRKIDRIVEILKGVDGVLLTGGEDLGEDKIYDELGFKVIHEVEKRNIPVLGVCRGMQLIAVAHGGSLTTHDCDTDLLRRHKAPSFSLAGHNVNIKPNSYLAKIFQEPVTHVNSLHHQSVANPGDLYISANSDDGTVEAVESADGAFVLGVQWHPELRALFSLKNEKLFKAFVEKAANPRK
jgi:putative glutamine amidotransferase